MITVRYIDAEDFTIEKESTLTIFHSSSVKLREKKASTRIALVIHSNLS